MMKRHWQRISQGVSHTRHRKIAYHDEVARALKHQKMLSDGRGRHIATLTKKGIVSPWCDVTRSDTGCPAEEARIYGYDRDVITCPSCIRMLSLRRGWMNWVP